MVDEDPVGGSRFYLDADGDGLGRAGTAIIACTAPPGYVDNADDWCAMENPGDCDANGDGCIDDADGNGICDTVFQLAVTDVVAGQPMDLDVSLAPPAARIFFGLSTVGLGSGPCATSASGMPVCTDIRRIITLGTAIAAADGTATLSLTVPNSVPPGLSLYFQAAHLDGDGEVTPVVTVTTAP